MFLSIVWFEIGYQLRRPSTYLYFGLLFLASFLLMSTGDLSPVGQVRVNAPYNIAEDLVELTMIAQVVTAAFIGLAVLRDFDVRAHELFFTTRITKANYLGGRFVGAVVVMALMFTALPLGLSVGTVMPWVDKAALQPFHLWHYVSPYLVLVLPTLVAVGAIFFAVGILTRSHLAVYVLGFVLFMANVIADNLRKNISNDGITAFTDSFGSSTFYLVTRYWTAVEKNTLTVPFAGVMLTNRLFLLAVAGVLVVVAFVAFRFDALPRSLRRSRASASESTPLLDDDALPARLLVRRQTTGAGWRETRATVQFSLAWIVRAIPFLAIATIAVIGISVEMWDMNRGNGPSYPLTYIMSNTVTGLLSIFLMVLVTLYAGELVWQERQLKADELLDSLPTSLSTLMIGRLVALLVAIALLFGIAIGVAVVAQTIWGYTHYELPLYLKFVYLTEFPRLVVLVLFAFFVHVMVNNKYVGHLVMIVAIAAVLTLDSLGFEHRLYQLGRTPDFVYSDLNAFGPYVAKLVWYTLYWTSFGALLIVIARLFAVRGTDAGWRARVALARKRFTLPVAVTGGVFSTLTAAFAGVIFYNSNVLQRYAPPAAGLDVKERYERAFKRFSKLGEPGLVDMTLRVDLVPERSTYSVGGRLAFVNSTARPIDTLLVSVVPGLGDPNQILDSLQFNRPVRLLSSSDSALGVRIYALGTSLARGDTILLAFGAHRTNRGFTNAKGAPAIVENGTLLSLDLVPSLGYDQDREIDDPNERKKRKLEGEAGRLPPLRDSLGTTPIQNWGTYDIVVSTAPDQIAIAPGDVTREWMENGRRLTEFRSRSPGPLNQAFVSARYAARRDSWHVPESNDSVAIAIYHHPTHAFNVDRMTRSVKRSLDYHTSNFGPYQFTQFRILEFPRYDDHAYAYSATIPFSESVGFITNVAVADAGIDLPFSITAHEMAHQWWGLQLRGALLEGTRMLNESLAMYGELMVDRKEYGELPTRLRRARMMDNYLNGRSRERHAEQPIIRNQGQDYLVYPKGGIVMFALADYLGEDRVNAALRNFLQHYHLPDGAPNTMNLVHELRAVTPDSLQSVITDLLETITLFENKADSASYTKRADGKYVVRLSVSTRKVRADSLGVETETPMNDLVDVGVFGAPVKGDPLGKLLYIAKHRFVGGRTTVEVVVDEPPVKAGIDPYRKLIDRIATDNVTTVRAP